MKHRDDIDGLRALAVLPVILFHAEIPGFGGGFIGVDVFFVISGYLITGLISREVEEKSFSLSRFYERRVRRILPALFLVVLVTLVAGWFYLMPLEFDLLGRSAVATVLSVSNFYFWSDTGYFSVTAEAKPLLHTWSLSVEEQFYVIFPVFFLLVRRLAPDRFRWWIGLAALTSFSISSVSAFLWPDAAFYSPWSRAWELLLGGMLALTAPREPWSAKSRDMLAFIGLALIAIPVFLYSDQLPFPGLLALIPCAGAGMILYAGADGGCLITRLLSTGGLVFIGLISYSLYLWHWPLLVFWRQASGTELGHAQIAAALVLTFALSMISWRYVEQPFRRSSRVSRGKVFAAVMSAGVVIVALGGAISIGQGWAWRLPERVNAILTQGAELGPYSQSPCLIFDGDGPTPDDIRSGKLCEIGVKDGPVSFLLIGDSHAGAMAPGLDAAAKRANLRGLFLGHGSCPPLLGYQRSQDSKHAYCKISNAAAMDLIRSHNIPHVLMTARWARYVNGTVYGNEGPFFDPSHPVETRDQTAMIAPLLDETLSAISAAGATAVLIADVPEIGYDAPFVLARAALQGAELDIRPSAGAVRERQALTAALLRNISAVHGVPVLSPSDLLCDAERCAVTSNGRLLYRDEDHLSIDGAHYISPLFDEYLQKIAKPPF